MSAKQLSDGNSEGWLLGQSASDKGAFYNGTPVVQPSGNAQAAVTRGANAGVVMGFSATNSPSSVATLTTAELGITLVGGTGAPVTIAAGDVLFVNKPTAQAGLGIGNVRVSSAGVAGVTFGNLSAGFLTPTASQVYSFMVVRGLTQVTATLTPTSVASNTTAEQIFSVTGIRAGELLQVSKATTQPGLDVVGVRAAGNNSVGITFANVTAGPLTPTAAQTYTFISLGGLDAQTNEIVYQVSAGTVTGVAAVSTAQANITITNLAASDIVTGITKPTQQNGLITGQGFVSSAGFVGITFGNVTSSGTLTPTGNEVYGVRTFRPNMAAPLVLYTQTLTPVAVAANTTAEQGFTVTGLVTSSMAWVNKPSATNGIGIVGARVSAFNTLGITFANYTSASITPPAESYVIGNFQMPVEATGNSFLQTAALVEQQSNQLGNAIRTALVSTGLMAGA